MEQMLYLRQKVKGILSRNELYLMPILKFVVMMVTLLIMNWHLGYRYILMKWVLVILASLVGCLLPWSGMTAILGLYLLGHVSALSWEGALVMAVVMFVAVMAHYMFLPGGSFLIVLVPLAFYFKVPYMVALMAGLCGSVLSFIPVGFGVIMYYLMMGLENSAGILSDPGSSMVQCALQAVNSLKEPAMFTSIAVLCLATLLVYGLRQLSLDYAKIIAVAAGGIFMILLSILGSFILAGSTSYVEVLVGCVISTLLAVLFTFWSEIVDYSRPEYLQYEDDEYVYYVKAVPKIQVTKSERTIQEINSRMDEDEDEEFDED